MAAWVVSVGFVHPIPGSVVGTSLAFGSLPLCSCEIANEPVSCTTLAYCFFLHHLSLSLIIPFHTSRQSTWCGWTERFVLLPFEWTASSPVSARPGFFRWLSHWRSVSFPTRASVVDDRQSCCHLQDKLIPFRGVESVGRAGRPMLLGSCTSPSRCSYLLFACLVCAASGFLSSSHREIRRFSNPSVPRQLRTCLACFSRLVRRLVLCVRFASFTHLGTSQRDEAAPPGAFPRVSRSNPLGLLLVRT